MNEMVRILLEEHNDWSVREALMTICSEHDDLEGLSMSSMYRHLSSENRKMLQDKGSSGDEVKTPKTNTEKSSTLDESRDNSGLNQIQSKNKHESNNENLDLNKSNPNEDINAAEDYKQLATDLFDAKKQLEIDLDQERKAKENWKIRAEQLEEVEKKRAFTPATDYKPGPPTTFQWPEPDESNTFVFRETTFDELRRALGPLKAGGNTKINVYLERVK